MKKLLALLLALGMLFSLAACGSSSTKSGSGGTTSDKGIVAGSNKGASGQTDKDVYLDMWGVWGQDNYRAMYWQQKAQEFCEKYEADTGTSVCFEYYGQGSYGELSEKLAAGAVTQALPVISQVKNRPPPFFHAGR